jgi:hypothetical protein
MESVNTATGAEAGSEVSISYLPGMPEFTVVSAFVAEALPTPENVADDIQENIEDTQEETAVPEPALAAEQAAILEPEPPIEEPATEPEQRPISQPESIGEAADPVQRTPSRPEMTEVERARERRALIVQYLLEVRRDDSDRFQGIGLQQQIRRELGFGDEEGLDDFHTLEQMAILTVEQHDPTLQEPDIFTIHPEEVCKAIDRGYLPESVGLILGYQPQPRPTAAKRPVEIRRPATPSQEAGGKTPVYTMSARTRKAIAVSEGQPRRATTPSTPRPTPEEARTGQGRIEPGDSSSSNRRGMPKRLNDPSQLPPEEVAARYEKSASIAEAATDYSLTAQEVSLLTHEQFMALALTTPALKRQFTSKNEFGPAVIEVTGLEDRALGTVISVLLQKEYVEKYDNADGLKLTPQGEKFLQEGIAAARR